MLGAKPSQNESTRRAKTPIRMVTYPMPMHCQRFNQILPLKPKVCIELQKPCERWNQMATIHRR